MRPILPIYLSTVHEPQVDLVNEGGRLEGMPWSLPRHIVLRYSMQLLIDERREFFQSLLISGSPSLEQPSDLVSRRNSHLSLYRFNTLHPVLARTHDVSPPSRTQQSLFTIFCFNR
jgi:hypothetical protein